MVRFLGHLTHLLNIFLLSDFLISVARPETSIKISMFTFFLVVAFQSRCLLAGEAELLVFEKNIGLFSSSEVIDL